MQQVEELKCIVRLIPIWISGIIYYIVLVQVQNYVVFQALQSDRRPIRAVDFKIPAATYNVITMITLTIWIPVYDRILVPVLRLVTKKEAGITILQRIGVGTLLGIVTMIISALVESHRRRLSYSSSSMSGNLLIPQLVMAGLSEGFSIIAFVEFFYKQFPANMRSLGASFLLCGFAISSYLSSFLISVVDRTTREGERGGGWLAEDLNHGRLDYFYYMVAGLEVVNLVYFLVCAKWYKYSNNPSDSRKMEERLDHKNGAI